jgi:hypothetical protein
MTLKQAKQIIGNQPQWTIRNMVKALQMCQWLNTEADWLRLEAGQLILKSRDSK